MNNTYEPGALIILYGVTHLHPHLLVKTLSDEYFTYFAGPHSLSHIQSQ